MTGPRFTELDVALFWRVGGTFTFSDWISLSAEERGIVTAAAAKMTAADGDVPDDPAPIDNPPEADAPLAPVLEKIPGMGQPGGDE